jgi:hypothetical protein
MSLYVHTGPYFKQLHLRNVFFYCQIQKCFGKDLRVREYGFANVVELADAMPDIVRIERPTKTGDWLLHSTKEHLGKLI